MRDSADLSVSGPQDVAAELFIITLKSSTTPMALEVPSLPELAGLAVFRSRKVEDGRDRFRLHLGYFESPDSAEAVLPAVREHFPAAWVGPAPSSGMGSLDDTSVAQFKFIKAPTTINQGSTSTRLRALTSTPASAPAAANSRPAATTVARPAAATVPRPATATVVRPATVTRGTSASAAAQPARKSALSATTPARPVKVPPSAPLQSRAVLDLLESGTPPPARVSPQVSHQPRERAAVIGAIQRFAVQLVWSTDPVNLTAVPKLAIFDAYTLYKVQVDRAGRRWYGLRLGFFADPVSARQVSLYARSDFSAAAVVPVSDRECDRALQAAVRELPEAPQPPKPAPEMQLIDIPRTPSPAPTLPRPIAKPNVEAAPGPQMKPAAKLAVQPPKPASSPPARQRSSAEPHGTTQKTRRTRSAAELAAELHTDRAFELDADDPLNDTGVRHLAVKVIKKDSRLGKLFKRGERR